MNKRSSLLAIPLALAIAGCSAGDDDPTAATAMRAEQSSSSLLATTAGPSGSSSADEDEDGGEDEGGSSLIIDVADDAGGTTTAPVAATTSSDPDADPITTATTAAASTTAGTAASTTAGTAASTTAGTAAPTTDAPSTTAAPAPPLTSGDGSNPIAVPVAHLSDIRSSGATRCIEVDLHTLPVPANPGYVGETLGGQQISGDQLWAITWYLMLYANCERQARGLEPFSMYPTDKQLAMQQTVLGINTSHGRFGERADIAGGLAAEGHGGGPLPGEPFTSGVYIEDDDGNGVWSVSEIARRSASGNQQNGGAGLVDHGGAMTGTKYSCIFAAASLGASEDHRVDIIIFYGSRC